MDKTPFTLENHITAGCNTFSSPRPILPNWIGRVITVLWLSKVYRHNPIHLRKSQLATACCNKFSSPRQILPNWIQCVIAVLWLSKVYEHAQLDSPYIARWRNQGGTRGTCPPLLDSPSIYFYWGRHVTHPLCPPSHSRLPPPLLRLRKSQYSWLQQILITETNSSILDMMCNSCIVALECVWTKLHSP